MPPIYDVTVCIPTITGRRDMLCRAVDSVAKQTYPRITLSVVEDVKHVGASATRNATVAKAQTEWVGFLDDDDELLPHHVELLVETAREKAVDVIWGWFEVVGGTDPFPSEFRGRQFDPEEPHCVPITYLIKRDLFMETSGFQPDPHLTGSWSIQDVPVLTDAYRLSGGRMLALPDTTWLWHHHANNTSGLAERT